MKKIVITVLVIALAGNAFGQFGQYAQGYLLPAYLR